MTETPEKIKNSSGACGDCLYSDRVEHAILCRVKHPTIDRDTGDAVWPSVHFTDWCGEYKCRDGVMIQPNLFKKRTVTIEFESTDFAELLKNLQKIETLASQDEAVS